MPQPTKGPRHGGSAAHQSMILANLATELIRHGRIRTTLAKAKSVQPLAERMITFAKRGDVAARRQVLKVIRDKDVVHKLFTDVGPAFAERNGGYTRILKLGTRKGDAAPLALIELVEGVSVQGAGDLEEQPRRRWSLRRRRGTLSATARETAEERQAAVDRGEDVGGEYDEAIDAVPAGSLQDADDDELLGGNAEAEPEPEVSAADVEARLAAMDTDADAQGVDVEDADASDDDEPITGPIPADEQDAPAPERMPDNQPTPTEGEPVDSPETADEQDAPAEERPPEG